MELQSKHTKKKARRVNREFKITFAPKICGNPDLTWTQVSRMLKSEGRQIKFGAHRDSLREVPARPAAQALSWTLKAVPTVKGRPPNQLQALFPQGPVKGPPVDFCPKVYHQRNPRNLKPRISLKSYQTYKTIGNTKTFGKKWNFIELY